MTRLNYIDPAQAVFWQAPFRSSSVRGLLMGPRRVAVAVEAAARALHETVRRPEQFGWEAMSETWRNDLRRYIQPSVEAALSASDAYLSGPRPRHLATNRPRVPSIRA